MSQGFLQVLSGGIIAIVSIFLTNYFNSKRIKDQMAFDEKQKALERLTKLRTDVYLDAAAQMVRMNSFMATLPRVDPTQLEKRTEHSDFVAATTKLSVVAESETTFQVNELVAAMSKAYFRALIEALPVQNLSGDIERAQRRFDESRILFDQAMQLGTEQLRMEKPSQAVLNNLYAERVEYSQQMKTAADEGAALREQHDVALKKFHQSILPLLATTRAPIVTALTRIRSDLGLTTQAGRWAEQQERHQNDALQELENVVASLEKMKP